MHSLCLAVSGSSEVLLLEHCVKCVLRDSVCVDRDVCRFGWCRCCGVKVYFVGDRWVLCPQCGFTNKRRKSRVSLDAF